jgi:myo-inositol-1(or 4)-monophosphatase
MPSTPPSINALHPMLDAAMAAARVAGVLIRAAATDPAGLQVRAKQPKDYVTQVDLASEQAIVRTLLGAFPGHAVRTEESAQLHGRPGADCVWIVDPLDGTTNFIHGYPAYAVSIALAVHGRIELGVVLDVGRDELFHATLGGGAYANGRRLAVAARAALQDAVVASCCPPRAGAGFAASMAMLGAVLQHAQALRRSGSAALDLAWVAAGRCDAQLDLGLNAWDVAAGGLLVSEAGGCVSDFLGQADFIESRECLAANPALHAALRAILAPYAPRDAAQN